MSKQSTIYHLEIGDKHLYYGSLSSIYDDFTPEQIGASLHTLWRRRISEDRPYIGLHCTIRRGVIKRKRQKTC